MKFNYNVAYNKPVDAQWVSRQFKIYDQYVKEYYDPRNLLNNFDGTSYDENGFVEYNIVNLGDVTKLDVVGRSIFNSDVTMKDDLSVEGGLVTKDIVWFKDSLSVDKDVTIGGDELIRGNLTVNKLVTLKDSLVVNKEVKFKSELNVDKDATFNSNANFNGDVNVTSVTFSNVKSTLCNNDEVANMI